MIALGTFFALGFFFPAFPWGFVAAAFVQLVAMMLARGPQLYLWFERSPALLMQGIGISVLATAALNGGAMLLANFIKWLVTGQMG